MADASCSSTPAEHEIATVATTVAVVRQCRFWIPTQPKNDAARHSWDVCTSVLDLVIRQATRYFENLSGAQRNESIALFTEIIYGSQTSLSQKEITMNVRGRNKIDSWLCAARETSLTSAEM
eukprot:IDg20333t1